MDETELKRLWGFITESLNNGVPFEEIDSDLDAWTASRKDVVQVIDLMEKRRKLL